GDDGGPDMGVDSGGDAADPGGRPTGARRPMGGLDAHTAARRRRIWQDAGHHRNGADRARGRPARRGVRDDSPLPHATSSPPRGGGGVTREISPLAAGASGGGHRDDPYSAD